jgi:hypothetical protein
MKDQRRDWEIAKCHVCGQTFPSQGVLLMHLTRAHKGDGLASEVDSLSDPGGRAV